MPGRVVTLHRWQVIAAFVAITLSFVVGLVAVVRLINDLQRSRIESCERTYEGVREIFKPLLPPVKTRTAKQRHDLKVFNDRIDQLKRGCARQIKTKGS